MGELLVLEPAPAKPDRLRPRDWAVAAVSQLLPVLVPVFFALHHFLGDRKKQARLFVGVLCLQLFAAVMVAVFCAQGQV